MMTSKELIKIIKNLNKGELPFRLATIDSNYTTGRPKVKFDGETAVSGKQYPYLNFYAPTANDRILLAKVSSSYVVLGKII